VIQLGGLFVFFAFRGLTQNGVPIGFVFVVFGALGLAGVEGVWYGGPLDPRNDPHNE